jgi:hypothetical protein
VATLTIEAQERRERRERQYGDRDDRYRYRVMTAVQLARTAPLRRRFPFVARERRKAVPP